jgi:hypothetical protein
MRMDHWLIVGFGFLLSILLPARFCDAAASHDELQICNLSVCISLGFRQATLQS